MLKVVAAAASMTAPTTPMYQLLESQPASISSAPGNPRTTQSCCSLTSPA
jgi:hypothetical protein